MKIKSIEIKAFKCLESMSEETLCFEANLYANGKKVGSCGNEGRGGCNYIWFDDRSIEDACYAYAKTLPPVVSDSLMDPHDPSKPFTIEMDLDHLITTLAHEKHEQQWDRKRAGWWRTFQKTRTAFRVLSKDYDEGGYSYYAKPFDMVKVILDNKYGPDGWAWCTCDEDIMQAQEGI